jgi:tRNA (guanine-N7-)-methyltransferase
MPRRALRKIDPSLDLSHNLLTLEEIAPRLSTEALFGRRAPLEVEVGSGKGLFLRTAAEKHPDVDYVGTEVAAKYAQFAAAALAKRGLTNAMVVHGDALRWFAEFLPDASLSAVHVYFPDPWWKKRHKKRRVMRESFLHDVQRTLICGGALHFWTDVEEYFRATLELVAACTRLVGPLAVAERPAEHDLDYCTHFERRNRQQNVPIYRAEFHKPAT